ncbi:MAG: NAD-dependent malic enzyme [Acidimicrobiia bacterium]
MRYQPAIDAVTGELYLPVAERGRALLEEPLLNKGTAFTEDERISLGISGLLPRHVSTLEEQIQRALDQIAYKDTDLQKHIYLAGLQDRNETLFYRLIMDNLTETVPLIYTPTVAEACRHWSRIFRRARGVYITPADRGRIDELLRNAGMTEAAVIVATDNERILGIGDQGAGGMGIPIGKLALYTAGGGIHPSLCLPISLDVGTDNEELLEDPLYLGVREPRLRGEEYWSLVDEFVAAVKRVFPAAILQWEDFANRTSFRHLDMYRDELPSFNDDIQGTAAMVVGGLLAAMRLLGQTMGEQRVLIAGAGSAGIGIARQIRAAMEQAGMDRSEAHRRILLADSRGLIVAGREGVDDRKAQFAAPPSVVAGWGHGGNTIDLETVVTEHRPSILIGVTGRSGTFTEPMIGAMAKEHDRPIVMPLSNPTTLTEAVPADILAWSEGRALIGTGSPFDDVVESGTRHIIGQANNVFVFPGIGLGAVVSQAKRITIGMFLAAAGALAAHMSRDRLEQGGLFPAITDVRAVSRSVALAVIEAAVAEEVAEPLLDPEAAVNRASWDPFYLPYRPA